MKTETLGSCSQGSRRCAAVAVSEEGSHRHAAVWQLPGCFQKLAGIQFGLEPNGKKEIKEDSRQSREPGQQPAPLQGRVCRLRSELSSAAFVATSSHGDGSVGGTDLVPLAGRCARPLHADPRDVAGLCLQSEWCPRQKRPRVLGQALCGWRVTQAAAFRFLHQRMD